MWMPVKCKYSSRKTGIVATEIIISRAITIHALAMILEQTILGLNALLHPYATCHCRSLCAWWYLPGMPVKFCPISKYNLTSSSFRGHIDKENKLRRLVLWQKELEFLLLALYWEQIFHLSRCCEDTPRRQGLQKASLLEGMDLLHLTS